MQNIIVNATALDGGGALTILKQFIEAIPESEEFYYTVFVSPLANIISNQLNLRIVPVENVKSLINRFMWDVFGVKKWLFVNKIQPSATISLQNTNFRVGYNVPNYIYYHQSITFFPKKWSLWRTEERPMWFYKKIYPFFVKLLLNKRTEIFVQLESVKEEFAKNFNFARDKIYVVSPKIVIPSIRENIELDQSKINLFYPATPFFYKNHKIIIKALSKIADNNFVLYLTCHENELPISYSGVDIRYMGIIPFEQVLRMYASIDALLFPSYIETCGLPLIEAASFGVSIFVSDLPYSREVLKGYEGVEYIDYTDEDKWVAAIKKIEKNKKYVPYSLPDLKSWDELFEIITRI